MILFILKSHLTSGGPGRTPSSGLENSATLVADVLRDFGIYTKVVTVVDSNSIDREVHQNKPRIVILEAIWCPPYKLKELAKLWPGIRWIVRIHSEIPFLANEGQAMDWLFQYKDIPNVIIGANSFRATEDLIIAGIPAVYLPNYHPINCFKAFRIEDKELNIGCFGAIRPMKNQLAQALAAIEYAKLQGKFLNFHMNTSRVEQGGQQTLKNLRALLSSDPTRFRLVEFPWMLTRDFMEMVRNMDVCLNVSFTETFCITAANAAAQNVPIVVSPEIPWASNEIKADPTSVKDILHKLEVALGHHRRKIIDDNLEGLQIYDEISIRKWLEVV